MNWKKILPVALFIMILAACQKDGDKILPRDENGRANTNEFTEEFYGKVVDGTDNTPLSGANVLGKGTTNGTNTDANGDFRIRIAGGVTGILVVSYTGYNSKEVTPGIYSNLGTIKLYPSP